MKTSMEKLGNNVVALRIEVDESEVTRAIEQGYKKVVRNVIIPGFRKGKAPRKLLELRLGKEPVQKEAMDMLMPKAYSAAVQEMALEPIDQPKVDVEQFEEGKPFVFKATVEVMPEVRLGDYRSVRAEREDFPVTDEDVTKYLEMLRERHARLVDAGKEEIEKGDFAVIDFEGFVEDRPMKDGKGKEQVLEVGGGRFLPGFEDQLIGARIGEKREVLVKFPEDYQPGEFAGKEAVFSVTVKDIKRKEVPEATDDFAREVGNFATFAELIGDIRSKLEKAAEDRAKVSFRNKVVEKVVEGAEVELPEVMVNRTIDQMVREFTQRLSGQTMTLEKYLEAVGMDEAAFREQFRKDAEREVKTRLVLDGVARAEGIQAGDEEVEARIQQIAQDLGRDAGDVKKLFVRQGGIEGLKDAIRRDKTISSLAEMCATQP